MAALAAEKPDHLRERRKERLKEAEFLCLRGPSSQKLPSAHRSKFKDTIVSDGLQGDPSHYAKP